MKRTISLIIAIAVMISMFVLPASAAEYDVDMTTLNGAARFTAAEAVTEWGITSDVVGLHYVTGEAGVTNGNVVDIPLDLSGCDTMVITYRNGVAAGSESSDIMLKSADYATTYGTFDLKGTGNWGTTAEASIDVSSITATTTTYHLQIQENATNGAWVTGIKLIGDNVSGGGSTTPPVSGTTVTTVDAIAAGTNVLGANIAGGKNISSGTYVIDLAGYKWTGQLFVSGTADVTIMDSSAGKTGVFDATTMGDGIDVSGGKITLDGVKVIGGFGSGDALFVSGGTVVSNNSILCAGKAAIDVTSASASVTVNGGTFATFPATPSTPADERNCAIEFRSNAKVTFNGDISFDVNRLICRDGHTNSFAASVTTGENVTVSFTDAARFTGNTSYQYTDMTYTYSVPMGDPAFVGASLTLTSGITLNFIAEGVNANAYVMVGTTRVTGTLREDGKYEFAFSDFGPQQMGDEFTAELYVNGSKVDELTYSVKEYCYDTINNAESSATLVKLAKSVLNYGAAAQTYKSYKTNALVNADLSPEDQAFTYEPGAARPTISADITPHYLWKSANVYFGDKISLVITFSENLEAGDYGVTVVDPAVVKSGVTGMQGVSFDIEHEIEVIEGGYQITVSDILPTEFRDSYLFRMYDAAGNRISNDLAYGISIYCALKDYVNVGLENANVAEPQGPINGLVKALIAYGDAATMYVNSL